MSKDVYIIIGNTDGKLSPEEWRQFQGDLKATVESAAEKVWGAWYSDSKTPYRNMCMGVLLAEDSMPPLKKKLGELASQYRQDSIAWSIAETEFIGAE